MLKPALALLPNLVISTAIILPVQSAAVASRCFSRARLAHHKLAQEGFCNVVFETDSASKVLARVVGW